MVNIIDKECLFHANVLKTLLTAKSKAMSGIGKDLLSMGHFPFLNFNQQTISTYFKQNVKNVLPNPCHLQETLGWVCTFQLQKWFYICQWTRPEIN